MYIFAIDPGNEESGYVLLSESLKPVRFGKSKNLDVLNELIHTLKTCSCEVCIEMVASYGMPVGAEVFETCVWIGRYKQLCSNFRITPTMIYRKDEKMNLCHSMKANDATITQALVDRFAPGQSNNHGKGTKANPGWFYGFKKDIWQAYAVGVTYYDLLNRKE